MTRDAGLYWHQLFTCYHHPSSLCRQFARGFLLDGRVEVLWTGGGALYPHCGMIM